MSFSRHVVLAGNPGVGKSFILNSILKRAVFKSGISLVNGLTQVLQPYEDPVTGIKYSDTPGLDDIDMRERAAEEISTALRGGGVFQLVFVCTLEEGRLKPADVTTVQVVLDAIENVGVRTANRYSVIINKCNNGVMELLDSVTNRNKIKAGFSRRKPLTHIEFFPVIDSAAGKTNFIVTDGPDYKEFIDGAPTIELPPDSNVKVDVQNFDSMEREIKAELDHLKKLLDEVKDDKHRQNKVLENFVHGVGVGLATAAVGVIAEELI